MMTADSDRTHRDDRDGYDSPFAHHVNPPCIERLYHRRSCNVMLSIPEGDSRENLDVLMPETVGKTPFVQFTGSKTVGAPHD